MSVREGIEFETVLESDFASLADLTKRMLEVCPSIRWWTCEIRREAACRVRALNELAAASARNRRRSAGNAQIPVRARGGAGRACEMLGLDPLYVANEGKLIAVVPHLNKATNYWKRCTPIRWGATPHASARLLREHPGMVILRLLSIGGERVVTMLARANSCRAFARSGFATL